MLAHVPAFFKHAAASFVSICHALTDSLLLSPAGSFDQFNAKALMLVGASSRGAAEKRSGGEEEQRRGAGEKRSRGEEEHLQTLGLEGCKYHPSPPRSTRAPPPPPVQVQVQVPLRPTSSAHLLVHLLPSGSGSTCERLVGLEAAPLLAHL
ncbi:unnamed protein product [Closterium sp. Naga37s-1]|nr:unnamed protein product [Closterium sp. Naga37s-1]